MKPFVGLVIVLALTSCATAATMENELRSDLHSALSLASETELFIQQIESGHLLAHFQAAHADYLRSEAQREAKEARDSEGKAQNPIGFDLCAKQLESLSRELRLIGINGDPKTVAESKRRVEIIRKTLIAAGANR
jgi:hypothetical protein